MSQLLATIDAPPPAAAAPAGRRPGRRPFPRTRRGRALATAGCVALFLGLPYALLTGPRDLGAYPPRATSPYRLPWVEGKSRLCVQGNRGIVSHRGWEEFAWDFAMPVGSEVRAARGGTVSRVEDSHDGNGLEAPNNLVAVEHGDGTTGWYLHLRKGGSRVRPGRYVERGEAIAESGNVGRSLLPHLHFQVTGKDGNTIPVSFKDVETDEGVPRMFRVYRSGNAAPEDGLEMH
ncbi:MAG: M23 family metallopeptidase [Planctomycetes bacterium]|nr:M23 family metallopeptidase [Planctomycetota bacterium]